MGHSTVYQLTHTNLGTEDFMTYSDLFEENYGFFGPVADSMDDSDRKDDFYCLIKQLTACDTAVCIDDNGNGYSRHLSWKFNETKNDETFIKFLPGYKCMYFGEKYRQFIKAIDQITENKFMSPNITCQVTGSFKHFGDKFGDYVFSGYPMKIDDFIRRLPDKEEVTYWLGGTVDYHF